MMAMDKAFIDKNVELSLELDSYLAEHFDLYEHIPNGALVIITVKADDDFNSKSLSLVRKSRSKRPVVEAEKSGSVWTLRPLAAAA